MKILGYELSLRRATTTPTTKSTNLMSVGSASWWSGWGSSFWGPILEPFTGAWQRNIVLDNRNVMLSFPAVYACVTGIASDIAKCRIKLVKLAKNDIWIEITENSPFLPVLRKPNYHQTRIQFIQNWIVSLLVFGNTYVLKERDQRGIVVGMYVLDPNRVTPLMAENGDVYYQLQTDYLANTQEPVTVPASEIIHDRIPSLWHPLIGVSPLYACGLSVTMGNKIQANSTTFFGSASRPSGIVTVPGEISNETATRLKTSFEANFSGVNVGRVAVLSDGMTFQPLTISAEQSQLIQQLKFTREDVGIAFHYPQSKLGGPSPQYASPEAVQLDYYTGCLQPKIEAMEDLLDEGLGLKPLGYGTELDLDNLMRMDTMALFQSNNAAKGWMTIDEQRRRANLQPIKGGNDIYMQQQDYSLRAIAQRDSMGPAPTSGNQPLQIPGGGNRPALPPAPEKPAPEKPAPGPKSDIVEIIKVERILPTDPHDQELLITGELLEILEVKYDPDQPRDDHGRWSEIGGSGGGGDGGSSSGNGSGSHPAGSDGGDDTFHEPTASGYARPKPIRVNKVKDAIPLVLAGKVVELPDVDKAHTLVERLGKMAIDAKDRGEDFKYDLCNVSVSGTNLFCGDTIGEARINMPQFKGVPTPGSPADKLPKNKKGEVDAGPAFQKYMRSLKVDVTTGTVPAAVLRASQREIEGGKVTAIMGKLRKKDLLAKSIYVSRDNYIIDGHHHWAAAIGKDIEDGHLGDIKMSVIKVDAPISEVLHLARVFTKEFGLPSRALGKRLDVVYLDEVIKYDPDQPRDDHGRWTDTGAGGGSGSSSEEKPFHTPANQGDLFPNEPDLFHQPESGTTQSEADRKAEESLRSSPVRSRHSLGGGVNGSYVVELQDGSRGVWKPNSEESNGFTATGTMYIREALAYDIAKITGDTDMVPQTVVREIDGEIGSLQRWVDDADVFANFNEDDVFENADLDQLQRGAAFDYILGNTDRHGGNAMWNPDTQKLTMIDNGFLLVRDNSTMPNRDVFLRGLRYHGEMVDPKVQKTWRDNRDKIMQVIRDADIDYEQADLVERRLDKFLEPGVSWGAGGIVGGSIHD